MKAPSFVLLLATAAMACAERVTPTPLPLEPKPSRAANLDPWFTTLTSAEVPPTHCARVGGRCIGPEQLRARAESPCPSGMYRSDYVTYEDRGEAKRVPACPAVPTGEEACCLFER